MTDLLRAFLVNLMTNAELTLKKYPILGISFSGSTLVLDYIKFLSPIFKFLALILGVLIAFRTYQLKTMERNEKLKGNDPDKKIKKNVRQIFKFRKKRKK